MDKSEMIRRKIKFTFLDRYNGEGIIIDSILKDSNTKYLIEVIKWDNKEYNTSVITIYPDEIMKFV